MKAAGLWICLAAGVSAMGSHSEGEIDRYRLGGAPTWTVTLPAELKEISGIAFTKDGRLFAHGDERAIVWELDPRSGRVLKSFALASSQKGKGKKKAAQSGTVAGDFEDIAIVGDRFFLVTSTGTLYEFREGADGARVPYTEHRTGLAGTCEIEGMAYDATGRALLLLCKENLPKKSAPKAVVVRAWSLAEGGLEAAPRLAVGYGAFAAATGANAFHGSALAFVPGGRSLLLIAGPQRAFAELTPDGQVAAAGVLERSINPQPEGLAFAPDGMLLISNEGAGGQPRLSGYAPAPVGRK
jgi:uncharacterized protein YjiK